MAEEFRSPLDLELLGRVVTQAGCQQPEEAVVALCHALFLFHGATPANVSWGVAKILVRVNRGQ